MVPIIVVLLFDDDEKIAIIMIIVIITSYTSLSQQLGRVQAKICTLFYVELKAN